MSFEVKVFMKNNDNKIEVTRKFKNATEKEVEVTKKVIPMPIPPPPFP